MPKASSKHCTLQGQLAEALQALEQSLSFTECELIISHCEINDYHGVGILIKRIFGDSKNIITIRSHDLYDGQQQFGNHHFLLEGKSLPDLAHKLSLQLQGYVPKRILCIPYFPDDYKLGLAIQKLYQCPLCVFMMDDQSIHIGNVEEELVRELINKADLCLGISKPLCEAYENKFQRNFWFVPPIVEKRLIQSQAPNLSHYHLNDLKGVMIGNVWSQRWLERLRELCRSTGVRLDWYGNPNREWLNFQEEELAGDGIYFRGFVPEDELVNLLRRANFAVIPTGSSNHPEDRPELTKLSLPSRSCFITATANLPILVVGDPDSAIAKFVASNGLGLVSSYQSQDFAQKIAKIIQADQQQKMRLQAFRLGQTLSADGLAQWIWQSLEKKQAIDLRFQRLENFARVNNASLVITLDEVTPRHGTGALVRRVFLQDEGIISVRSHNHYGGDHAFGAKSYQISHCDWKRQAVYKNLANIFGDDDLGRVFCVPYSSQEVLKAIAVKDLFGVPLGVWIMDDQNIVVNNISDDLMREFLEKADIRFATHPELRDAYENKYGLKFWILPAVVPHNLIKTEVFTPKPEYCEAKRGALLGSIWSERWFNALCQSSKPAGISLDWFGNSRYHWLNSSEAELQANGIYHQGLYPEPELVEKLKEYPFVIVPTGTMDKQDDQPQFSKLSLPGRILFNLATANTPVILMGSPKTSSASFIKRFGMGVVCDYTPESLAAAVMDVLQPERQKEMRENAVKVAESFSDKNIDTWIWQSLEAQQAIDTRFEDLFRRSPIDLVHFIEPPVPKSIYKDYAQVYQVMRRLKVNQYQPDFVVDVGASHGIWSHTTSQIFPETQFILIDPLISRYEQSAWDYYLKNIPRAQFLAIAVSNHSGELSFQVSSDLYGSSLLNPVDFRNDKTVTVPVKTLDQVAEEAAIEGRGILKLDVQCAGHIVLEGAKKFLSQVDLVVAELSFVRYDEQALVFLEMLNRLDELGFRYYDETGEWRSPIDGTLLQKKVVLIRQHLLVPDTSRRI